MTEAEIARDLAISKANGPTDDDLSMLAKHSEEALETGYIFQPDEHFIEEMIKQAQALTLLKLL